MGFLNTDMGFLIAHYYGYGVSNSTSLNTDIIMRIANLLVAHHPGIKPTSTPQTVYIIRGSEAAKRFYSP